MALRAPRSLVFCMAAGACGGDATGGGTLVDDLPSLAVREEVRIGSVEDPEAGFSRIGGVTVGPEGLIYVLEAQAQEIRVYDAAEDTFPA